jgi:hypothetical protein
MILQVHVTSWLESLNSGNMNIMFFNLVLVYTNCKEVLSGIVFS